MAKFCLSIFEEQQRSSVELDLNGKLTECLKVITDKYDVETLHPNMHAHGLHAYIFTYVWL